MAGTGKRKRGKRQGRRKRRGKRQGRRREGGRGGGRGKEEEEAGTGKAFAGRELASAALTDRELA